MHPFVRWRDAPVLMTAVTASALLAVACSATSGSTSDGVRTVVVLTADQATEIVVPAGFASATTSIPDPDPSEPPVPDAETSSADTFPSDTGSASSDSSTSETSTTAVNEDEADGYSDGESDQQAASTTVAEVAVTTTVVEVVKETVPLAEEERVHPGVRLMSALDEFNACLAEEGHEWIGFPDAAAGPEAPANQPAYLQALQLCNSRTGISDAYQSYETSRSDLSPEEIRQENQNFIDLVDCLRGLGWLVGDLRPDEDGLLNPGDEFVGPDGGIVSDDIRDCASEIALAAETEE
ncbi:MAG: hypothetical protein P8Q20_06095 [Acidimicrobiales bacterium]|nr:hypothetical protein [Acidimicrobiales bacterium]